MHDEAKVTQVEGTNEQVEDASDEVFAALPHLPLPIYSLFRFSAACVSSSLSLDAALIRPLCQTSARRSIVKLNTSPHGKETMEDP